MVGTNALFMQEDAARESAGLTWSAGRLQTAFEAAQRAGARVLRVTAFNDGQRDVAAIQTERGVYSEIGLVGLDRVIAEAGRRDVLLLMVLSNYWPDYGGITQYLRWRELGDDRGRFFDDPRFVEDLSSYAEHLIGRMNTVTGIRYGEDPTILGWEIMNEPRGDGLTDRGEQHTRFLEAVARRNKPAAPHQLVVAGDEGFDLDLHGYDMNYWGRMVEARVLGEPRHQSYRMTVHSDAFDAATLHFYPEVWGVRLGDEGSSGLHWIHEHAAIAMEANKPVLFEEFGLGDPRRHGPRMDIEPRRRAYEQWFRWSFEEPNFAAVMPWGFTSPGREGDGYAWGGHDPERDDYLAIVQRWGRRFDEVSDASDCDHPVPMQWPHE